MIHVVGSFLGFLLCFGVANPVRRDTFTPSPFNPLYSSSEEDYPFQIFRNVFHDGKTLVCRLFFYLLYSHS